MNGKRAQILIRLLIGAVALGVIWAMYALALLAMTGRIHV